ncbi:unnamed protein product [Calypogeia fissa]
MDQSLNFSVSKDEKLKGNNYPIWSYKMEQNYVKERVWYVVRENVRGAAVDLNDPPNPTPAECRADQSKALYMLTKAVDDQILARFTNIRDPAVLWAELKRACAGNTVTHRSVLERKLFSLRFPESATMSQNFSSINELLNQLAAVGVSFTNEELNGFVIDALPSSWEIFGSVIRGRETTPTFVQLENLIREEEIRRSSRAFAGLKSELDSAIACVSQLKVGAPIVNVAESVPIFEETYITDSNDSQVTADQVLEANLSELASSSSNPWILDSGANTHLTGEPTGLSNLVSVSPGPTVATAGGPVLDIKGKGTLFFGKNKVEDVWYVPCARRNLLSVGKITDLGHTVCFTSKQCLVFDRH